MNRLKRFNEFWDLGNDTIWSRGKVGQEVAAKVKPTAAKKLPKTNYDSSYKARDAVNAKIATVAKPEDLPKHTVKPLSEQKKHADYSVHHVKGKDGSYSTALLHHKTKGFVGLLNGTKQSDGFHVSESFISPLHRGKGLGVALYDHAATHHKGIVSDSSLTAHSQKIYGHFAKEGRLTVHAPNFKTPIEKRIKDNEDSGHSSPLIVHGEPVSVKSVTPLRARVFKSSNKKKVANKLVFSTAHHEDLSRGSSMARLRIEPKSKSK